jgi:hypothetical protein
MNITEEFKVDVVLLSTIPSADPALLLPHVLPMPIPCPGWCGDDYVVLISQPLAREIEIGLCGQKHLALLKAALTAFCVEGNRTPHLRTDGHTVWAVVPFITWEAPVSHMERCC